MDILNLEFFTISDWKIYDFMFEEMKKNPTRTLNLFHVLMILKKFPRLKRLAVTFWPTLKQRSL